LGGGADSCGSKEPCIIRGPDWTNSFATAADDKSAMWPFAKLLWTLLDFQTTDCALGCYVGLNTFDAMQAGAL